MTSAARRLLSGAPGAALVVLSGALGLATGSAAALQQAPWALSPANLSCSLTWGAIVGAGFAAPLLLGTAGRTARLTLAVCLAAGALAAALSCALVSVGAAC